MKTNLGRKSFKKSVSSNDFLPLYAFLYSCGMTMRGKRAKKVEEMLVYMMIG